MNSWLKAWIPFLFGTPQRTLVTAAVIGTVILAAEPSIARAVVSRLTLALGPIVEGLFLLAILGFGLAVIVKKGFGMGGSSGGGKKKKAK